MSQDTLALFSNIVREHQGNKRAYAAHPPSPSFRPEGNERNIRRKRLRVYHDASRSLAKASLISTLSGAHPLHNPFLDFFHPETNQLSDNPMAQLPLQKCSNSLSNASDSYQDMEASFECEHKLPPSAKQASTSLSTLNHTPEDMKSLKLRLVSSTQGRKMSLDFETRALAGKGAFSEVWQVTHRLDGCTYAIKRNTLPHNSDKARWDALQEVFALSALQGHPNILRYYDAWFEEAGRHLLIQTEYLPKGSLYSLYVDRARSMNAEELLALASDMSCALSYIHKKGIAHLDVKPDNIFRSNRILGQESYVIGDFGLACHKDGYDARTTEGDARYLRPEALAENSLPMSAYSIEQNSLKNKEASFFDLRAGDVFSLGATLYELGMGVPLTKNGRQQNGSGIVLKAMAQEVGAKCQSPLVTEIVSRCLELDPGQRATAHEVRDMCKSHPSSGSADTINRLAKELRETKEKLRQHRTWMRSLMRRGEAVRDQYRSKFSNSSTLMPSQVMEL